MDWEETPVSSVLGECPGKNTGVGCHALPQGVFSTQGSNPGLPHCRRILYHLSHQGSPKHTHPPKLKGFLAFLDSFANYVGNMRRL